MIGQMNRPAWGNEPNRALRPGDGLVNMGLGEAPTVIMSAVIALADRGAATAVVMGPHMLAEIPVKPSVVSAPKA